LTGALGATADPKMAAIATLPLVGVGTRKAANALTSRQLANADKLVRARSPLYERLLAEAPGVVDTPEIRAALARAFLAAQAAEFQ
jgi:hypothetical protein